MVPICADYSYMQFKFSLYGNNLEIEEQLPENK